MSSIYEITPGGPWVDLDKLVAVHLEPASGIVLSLANGQYLDAATNHPSADIPPIALALVGAWKARRDGLPRPPG